MENKYQPLSGRVMPRFGGIKTFFRLPHETDLDQEFHVGLFGVPYDGAVSYRPGARFAPSRIREMSSLGRGYHMSRDQKVFDQLKVADIGDCFVVPMSQEKTYESIESFDANLLEKGKAPFAVGGDHSTTLAHLRALKKKLGKKISLVHFDAHLDTYPAAWGCEYHHGAFVRHALEEGLIDASKSIQIGIRGPLAGREDLDVNQKFGLKVLTVDDIRQIRDFDYSKILGVTEGPTFISFDIDCLDPSCAPGTGTPVPGGLTTYEAQKLLQCLEIKNLVGADLVEVSPPFDSSDITSLAAVDVIFEILNIFRSSLG